MDMKKAAKKSASIYIMIGLLFLVMTRIYIFTTTDIIENVYIWKIIGAQISYVFILVTCYFIIKKSRLHYINAVLGTTTVVISILLMPALGYLILLLMFSIMFIGNKYVPLS
jgi:hypothetical protein